MHESFDGRFYQANDDRGRETNKKDNNKHENHFRRLQLLKLGKFPEVYLEFKRIEVINHNYEETRKKTVERF